jgi:hypothetical protein
LLSAACQRQVDVVSGGEVSSVTPVNANTLPAGSTLHARLNNDLSTESTKVGDTFTMTVTENVVATNGAVVVPSGATLEGRVTGVDDSDDPTDKALLQLQFDRMRFGGRTYPFSASVQSVAARGHGRGDRRRDRRDHQRRGARRDSQGWRDRRRGGDGHLDGRRRCGASDPCRDNDHRALESGGLDSLSRHAPMECAARRP